MSRVFDEVAEVIGPESTAELAARFGGIPLHIPVSPGGDSVIVLAIGREKAKRLAAIYGGCRIQLPSKRAAESANRKRAIETSIKNGMPHTDIALAQGVSVQWVQQIARRMRAQ